jgi:alginate O-acetyltransferase complex protein AlgI
MFETTPLFTPDWALPLGISFVTFTSIAMVIDVRRGDYSGDRSFWNVALFISFFPQLIAGPILRARELMPQLNAIRFQPSVIKTALLLFVLGAAKKVGVADQIAPVTDRIFSGDGSVSQAEFVIALYGFAVQIYCDFSGYTDMALALGMILGVNLPLNFDRPYLAGSIREFWQRWHMTLSRWLRDYLYIPLGGNRYGLQQSMIAVLITMLLGGLWHGAAWTFVFWGGLHGLAIIIERYGSKFFTISPSTLLPGRQIFIFHFVALSWLIFRAPDFSRAIDIFSGVWNPGNFSIFINNPVVAIVIILVIALHKWDRVENIKKLVEHLPLSVVSTFSILLILICAALNTANPSAFIYFDF